MFAGNDAVTVKNLDAVLAVLNPQPHDQATFEALRDIPLPATNPLDPR